MNNFTFHNPTKIIFGKDTHLEIGAELKAYGIKKALLLYGTGSIKRSGLYDSTVKSLRDAGIEFVEFDGVVSNPVISHTREAVKVAKDAHVDAVLSVGGGSVLDEAKAVAAAALVDHDVWDFFTGTAMSQSLPIFSILTLAATGSEMNGNSVITNDATEQKFSFTSSFSYPKISILNPELTFSVDPAYTAYGSVDAIAHVIEGYFTQSSGALIQDRLTENIIKSVIESTDIIMKKPDDYDARAQMMWSATMALNGMPVIGLKDVSFPNHMIEHALSAIYNIAHGAGLSIVIPAWMQWYKEQKPERFKRFAQEVFGLENEMDGINALKDWFRTIGSPVSLSEVNIPAEDIPKIVANASEMAKMWGLGTLYTQSEITKILQLAI
ncbi:MAG: iron-containing alcohol dehydrogenase [Thiovulaceae bacterium]|nr:iron-containing alcohol dehydrogenase [Sulfurimonadaceae bacterium]